MVLDPVELSRIQFAFTISFHIIFPAFTIGLAAWLATLEGLHLATGNRLYRRLFAFWLKVFAVAFGLGVVSGIVMAFQFGTNWSELATRTGPIQGPLLAYESFTAFLLEATFFGVLMFGRDRVPRWAYFASTLMVALGTTFSAFWIMANNTWMQVPMGYALVGEDTVPTDWAAILFNDVLWVRFPHMLLGAYLTTAFCVAATGAWYLLRHRHQQAARTMLAMGLGLAAVLTPAQIVVGHFNGEYTAHHQPAKFTAMEGRWQTEQPARLLLLAWPDIAAERNTFELGIPYLGSFVTKGNFSAAEPGIVTVPEDERPPFLIPFYGFRIMVGLGLVMLALSWGGVWLMAQGRLREPERLPRWFLWVTFLHFPSGFIAVLAGWFTAEVGRQPWVVQGLLRTADAVTPSLSGEAVLVSLVGYVTVYALIFSAGTLYIYRLLRAGLDDTDPEPGDPDSAAAPSAEPSLTASRPLAVAGGALRLEAAPSAPGRDPIQSGRRPTW
jgi:cytochrome d ubiquinol oxidase subunit I